MNYLKTILASTLLGSLSVPAIAAPSASERTVTVRGEGELRAVPDQARMSFEVTEQGKKVDEVTALVRRKMEAIHAAIRKEGIPDSGIQTRAYEVTPLTKWDNGRSERIGFQASNRVEVTVQDLSKLGRLISRGIDAGANTISGPQYEFQKPQELERQALSLAMADAKVKAELLARAGGATLGPVVTINEEGTSRPPVMPLRMAFGKMAMAQESAPEPIAAGQETIKANINVSFSLR